MRDIIAVAVCCLFVFFADLSSLCLVGRYRLAAGVLRYPLPNLLAKETAASESAVEDAGGGGVGGRLLATTTSGGRKGGDTDASEFVAAFDGALPERMLSHLQVRHAR